MRWIEWHGQKPNIIPYSTGLCSSHTTGYDSSICGTSSLSLCPSSGSVLGVYNPRLTSLMLSVAGGIWTTRGPCHPLARRIEDETLVHLWIDVYVVFIGHCQPFGLDHVLFSLLVAPVEDGAVTLGASATNVTPSIKGSSSSPQHPIPEPSSGHFSG
jgi:hypothetical protein